ncbi:uncharacterized protein LOC106766185 [Vigna radiata var. radiata]|uniref:Uncharacterized protein LOC106766185 n=1 Tax=Vigna radiata var. radiata TaxID=3916 RepID=A0A1S3UK69_VIGRR|nr:uncharacterized protein LOC106766185 [Vigna radiata var. radiata]
MVKLIAVGGAESARHKEESDDEEDLEPTMERDDGVRRRNSRNEEVAYVDKSSSRAEKLNLQATKLMRFLNIKKDDRIQNENKEDVHERDLIMMAKFETTKKCLRQGTKSSMWYLDSGCSRHITGDPTKFISISYKTSGHVTYGDNNKGKIIGIGQIKTPSSYKTKNVLLVEGLKHNLLSIS